MPRTRQPKPAAAATGPPPAAAAAPPGQPVRVAGDQPYGDRKAAVAQQQGAGLVIAPQHQPQTQPRPGGAPAPVQQPGIDPASLFAPTEQPNMPIVGGPPTPKIIPDDPYMLVRQIYSVYPNPDIARLMRGIPDI